MSTPTPCPTLQRKLACHWICLVGSLALLLPILYFEWLLTDRLELILRGQVAFGMIKEDKGVFVANRLTRLLVGSNSSGAVNYM